MDDGSSESESSATIFPEDSNILPLDKPAVVAGNFDACSNKQKNMDVVVVDSPGMFVRPEVPGPEVPKFPLEFREELQTVEICCGCARLTLSCKREGLNALGVDWNGCKDKPEGRVIWIDLATKRGLDELIQRLEANKGTLKVVFMSPPCGTASRAREIRRKKPKFGKWIDPKPFRSDEFPDGLPSLKGNAAEKVRIANALYANMVEIAMWCDKNGVAWVMENPKNSHYWETAPLKELRRRKWSEDEAEKLKEPYCRSDFQLHARWR